MHSFEEFLLINNIFYNNFLICLKICFFVFISLFNINNLFNYKLVVELDNEIKNDLYEKNEEYKNYGGTKIFCIYYPEYSFYKSTNTTHNNTLNLFYHLNK